MSLTAKPAVGDTSATLTANFPYITGNFTATFSDSEVRTVTLTGGAKTCTWSGGLTGSPQALISVVGARDGAQTGATALPANKARNFLEIQNQDSSPLFVYFGTGASTTVYHFVLKAGTGTADGTGGSFSSASAVYRGLVTVASAGTPSYSVFEL